MPIWREYQCSQCGDLFMVKDIELTGNIICPSHWIVDNKETA